MIKGSGEPLPFNKATSINPNDSHQASHHRPSELPRNYASLTSHLSQPHPFAPAGI